MTGHFNALRRPRPRASSARTGVAALILLLLFALFWLDLVTPLGVTVYALFTVVVLLGVVARQPMLVLVSAVLASVFIVIGLYIHQYEFTLWRTALINRGLALVTVWSAVMLSVIIERNRRALERHELQLERLVREDPLTGVANRRRFGEALHAECSRAVRDQAPLSLLMIDIDHFKEYNDELGHPVGDECLIQIAAAIRTQLSRPTDLVARYGGEEFAVLLPATPLDGARELAEQIRMAVQNLAVQHPRGGVVTISLGIVTHQPVSATDCENRLVASADQALYLAKEAGRNRIHVAEPENFQ